MSAVIELRQYTLKPGQRDTLIDLFEREFVETQEAEGMDVIGIFRDEADADRFVWLRGFPDMESRAKSLAAFYGGPVWKAHRNAANATMIDSDNVLLLKPAWNNSGFGSGGVRAAAETKATSDNVVAATICYFGAPVSGEIIEQFRTALQRDPRFLAAFVTESAANTFPGLPVREGENVFVGISRSTDTAVPGGLQPMWIETLRLKPTARSKLR
ncbi:MAG TPA: NIPSNAP family protein [Rhizomicrobium sp.]|jgi:quinol monooxygenase YgiN